MWATQYTPNNLAALKMPGVVSDGRVFTNYSPETELNDKLRKLYDLKTNRDYKKYLTENTKEIMRTNLQHSMYWSNTTVPEGSNQQHGTPFLFYSVEDQSRPYGYEDSFPKNMYLTRQMLDVKKRRPIRHTYE
jgi:hypothetical protein